MVQKHYKNELVAFIDHELSKDEQHEIGEHLMQCGDCRREHDRLKLGVQLAGRMDRSDAGPHLWNEIEDILDGRKGPQISLIGPTPHFGFRNWAGYAIAAVMVTVLISGAYFTLFGPRGYEYGRTDQATPSTEIQNREAASIDEANVIVPDADRSPIMEASPADKADLPAWDFVAISGNPKISAAAGSSRLAVGDYLETDSTSRARIAVADIGNVEIHPNSLVKLVGTDPKEHRLSLERGKLKAQIFAPPRLFIVDTPSAVAVDLGCEYTLDVDKAGNSFLHVTSGFVALERDGRESIVPAGAMCMTKRGKGLGTPFSAETSTAFRAALENFDFAGGGSRAIDQILATRSSHDIISLWHLLSRVQRSDRDKVYDALSAYVEPPADVTREGILSLNKKMLESWRIEVESAWFE